MARNAVKKVKNAILYDDGCILISNVRLSYPHLKKPYKGDGDQGEAKYGVVGLLPKDTHKAAKKLIEERIDELLKENKVKALASDKKFLRDGDESGKDENEGCWTVSARETKRPILRQKTDDDPKEPVEREDADEVFYGGCWGSILVRPWYQDNKFGKRVNAGLTAVRKTRDDEAFGEGRISEEEVDEAFDEDDDEDEGSSRRSSGRGSSKGGRNRHEDEDDDDDRGSRRRRSSRDDDEDEDRGSRRSSRRRSRDEDDDDDL